jgi:hypothetical protein
MRHPETYDECRLSGADGSNADTAEPITSGRIEEPLLDLLCGAARKSQMRLQLSMAGKAGAFVGPY